MTTIGKTDLIAQIYKDSPIEKATIQKIFEATIEAVKKALKDGQEVRLVGFGSFVIQESAERQGRNPRTGDAITIKASKRVGFRMGKELKEAVNNEKVSNAQR
jgi:DNA-binding protein HU-beta